MKHLTHLAALCACLTSFPVSAHVQEVMNEPDSVYLFSYATVNDAGRSGLKLAWSTNEARWFSIGNGYGYVKCDSAPGEQRNACLILIWCGMKKEYGTASGS